MVNTYSLNYVPSMPTNTIESTLSTRFKGHSNIHMNKRTMNTHEVFLLLIKFDIYH